MTRLIAPECRCRYSTSLGEKKPEACEKHGNRFVYASTHEREVVQPGEKKLHLDKPRRKTGGPPRDWSLAVAKKEEEGRCRVCNAPAMWDLECAHILGRKYDQPISPNSKTLLVIPDRIVPLCGVRGHSCHQRYDAHELDLLPYLTTAEQAQAVLDAGSIGRALKRISPEAHVHA